MKIYFNEAFVETKRETNDLWVKGDNGDMLYAFFEGVDLSEPNIYTRLIIQWANGQATNELPMNKSFDKKSAYVTLPILKAGETKFTIRIYENGVLNHTAIFTRVVKESIDASDDTNISPDEYLGINNAINNNTTNIAKNGRDIATNTTNIAKNGRDIATNTTNIATNTTNIAKNGRDITDLKSGKVDKTNTPNHVYGTDEAGKQTIIPYRSDLEPLEELEKSIIIRDNYGRAEVNWPETEDEIANKEYVDIQRKNSEAANKRYVDGKIENLEAETEYKLDNLEAETENKVGLLEERTEYKLNGKADKTFVNPAFKDVEVAKNAINGTYTFTFTKLDNTTKEVQIDTPEEFIIDYNKPPYLEGNNLIITFVGGSTISIDMSTLVKYNTLENTTTITLTEDSNHKVTATLNDGSVKLSHLNTEVISKINSKQDTLSPTQLSNIDDVSNKQDKLTAGEGININDNTVNVLQYDKMKYDIAKMKNQIYQTTVAEVKETFEGKEIAIPNTIKVDGEDHTLIDNQDFKVAKLTGQIKKTKNLYLPINPDLTDPNIIYDATTGIFTVKKEITIGLNITFDNNVNIPIGSKITLSNEILEGNIISGSILPIIRFEGMSASFGATLTSQVPVPSKVVKNTTTTGKLNSIGLRVENPNFATDIKFRIMLNIGDEIPFVKAGKLGETINFNQELKEDDFIEVVKNTDNDLYNVYLFKDNVSSTLFTNLTKDKVSLLTNVNGLIKVNTINDDIVTPKITFKFDIKYWREN